MTVEEFVADCRAHGYHTPLMVRRWAMQLNMDRKTVEPLVTMQTMNQAIDMMERERADRPGS